MIQRLGHRYGLRQEGQDELHPIMVRPRTRRRRRKSRTPRVGGSPGSLLKAAASLGVKLGKWKRYKRMGAKGVRGAVSKFRRKPWEV